MRGFIKSQLSIAFMYRFMESISRLENVYMQERDIRLHKSGLIIYLENCKKLTIGVFLIHACSNMLDGEWPQ